MIANMLVAFSVQLILNVIFLQSNWLLVLNNIIVSTSNKTTNVIYIKTICCSTYLQLVIALQTCFKNTYATTT